MNNKPHSQRTKNKISEKMRLVWKSKDWRDRNKKVSRSLIGNKRRVGKIPWNKGKKGLQKHSEKWKRELSRRMKGNTFNLKLSDSERAIRKEARRLLYVAVNNGSIVKKPCSECGVLKVEAHHEDYNYPLRVEWLCNKHHKGLKHKKNVIK